MNAIFERRRFASHEQLRIRATSRLLVSTKINNLFISGPNLKTKLQPWYDWKALEKLNRVVPGV